MPSRHKDWLRQAKKDLEHAKHSLENGDYEWACFASQQSAEKAVKAMYQSIGADAWGHSVSILLTNFPNTNDQTDRSTNNIADCSTAASENAISTIDIIDELVELAKELDKHYISPRYPNSHPEGAPFDYYTKREAERAIDYAEKIIFFCEDKLL